MGGREIFLVATVLLYLLYACLGENDGMTKLLLSVVKPLIACTNLCKQQLNENTMAGTEYNGNTVTNKKAVILM